MGKRNIKTTLYIVVLFLSVILVFYIFFLYNNSSSKNKKNNFSGDDHSNLSSNKKYIVLTFDDGWSSQYKAFKMLKPLKGTLYICPSLIGKEDRLTLENLTKMYNHGWDICNHTVHHTNLTKVNLAEAYNEVYDCSLWLMEHGFIRNMDYNHFAYPEGGYNKDVLGMLEKLNILTARTTNAGNNTDILLQLGRTSLHGMTKENIRSNIVSDKKILILSFHRIVPDNTNNLGEIDLKESYFKQVINSIYESKREVITITEWYQMNKKELK